MEANLYKASEQWCKRPDDERFESLDAAHAATLGYFTASSQVSARTGDLRVEADNKELTLIGKQGVPARLSHWAFGQLSARASAPASYLRTLPATLAAQNINHGLKAKGDDSFSNLLLQRVNGNHLVRAFTSDRYSRIWNHEVIKRTMSLRENGWRVPPARPARPEQVGARPATQADILNDAGFNLSIKVGDLIAPAGIYASDHDCFIFMVNESARIADGSEGGLSRGFFLENSEVGASAFKLTTFLYRHVCGNHIVWDASKVDELSIRHVGSADHRYYRELAITLRHYADESASDTEARIKKAREFRLAIDKEKLLDLIFGKKILSRSDADKSYELARTCEPDSPLSAWGFAQGVTRLSQAEAYAENRVALDNAANKVLNLAGIF